MIFITVGSRSFQFNRLLEAIDKAVESGFIMDELFAQIGSSDYEPKYFPYVKFLNHTDFNNCIEECDTVITHGGTGVIMNSIKRGKKVIAVPRLAKYHEVVDDHQIQLVREFERMGMIIACYECDKIAEAIEQSKWKTLISYESNTSNVIHSIESYITSMRGKSV